MKKRELFAEFCRYVVVGGTAFLVDIGLLYIFFNFVFFGFVKTGLYIATFLAFFGSLVYNYWLSVLFVFKDAQLAEVKSTRTFFAVALVAIVGLILTELGMFVGVELLAFHYLRVKAFVGAVVLIWNYGARKVWIFR